MGTAITELLSGQEITIGDLKGKILAVDSFNMLYQFLSSIRQADGTPLKDSKGYVTSHLSGLLSRITKLMKEDIRFVFVFDGESPELKIAERKRRKGIKDDALEKYEKAKAEEDVESMKKYASRTSVLTTDMIEESKELIKALGMPVVDAPSEGEAQCSKMVENGDCYAVLSQDADALVFGAPRVVRNLTITGRKKMVNKLQYKTVNPQIISLQDTLNELGFNQDQLIVLSILVGTDYNYGGVKGIGPKKAVDLLKKHGQDFDSLFSDLEGDFDWKEIFHTIKNMKTTDDYKIVFDNIHKEKILEILVKKHEFSQERVERALGKFKKEDKKQKGLGEFF